MSELIQLDSVGNILSNIGNKLIQNQNLLKCIKYNTSDALSQSDLGMQDIINLIGKGSDPKTQQKIYKTPFNDKILDDVRSELRFFVPYFRPENIYLSEVIISFQIIIYNTLWELDDNQARPLILIKEILQDFNGYDIGSIGLLRLDGAIKIYNWNDNFTGYQLNFKTRTQ